jgi:very-short-patch-repair endonuclease
MAARTESPIEEQMLHALVTNGAQRQFRVFINSAEETPGIVRLDLHLQVRIGGYRVDLVAAVDDTEHGVRGVLAIECDGHEFHERTKAQAARDRRKDRLFQAHGVPLFRFTGSEIWADADACADEALDALLGLPDPAHGLRLLSHP